jgi:hypothetical protein
MYKNLFTLLLAIVMIGSINSSFSTDKNKSYKIVRNGDVLRGDNGPFVYNSTRVEYDLNTYPRVFSNSVGSSVITEVNTNARTQYDLQSNSVIQYIWQNPADANEMHAVFMTSTDPGPSWGDRNGRYFYTSNGGTSWDYVGVVATTRGGFPCITATNDSRAVVLLHSSENDPTTRTYLFVDVFAGAGTWTTLDPGLSSPGLGNIWPYAYATRQAPAKVLFASSQNGVDSCFYDIATNLTAPGTFTGWTPVPNGETAEQYYVAISDDGTRYGVAALTLSGGAIFMESTNGGTTFGSPQTVWTWNPADSMGTIRSISLIYKGAQPCVALGLAHTDPVGGTFTPGLSAKMVFWSPSINGGNVVTVDSAGGLSGSNSTNDVFLSVTRGVIGVSKDQNAIYIAYNKARPDTSSIGNNFFDIYTSFSTNNGASWSVPFRATNNTGPLRDYRYVAIAPSNSYDLAGPNHYLHLISQSDSIPGSNVNGAPASTAQMVYIKVSYNDPIGIQPISNEVPTGFQLMQNYPNPFNPTTKIRFAMPVSGFTTLKLYDATGKEVSTLLSQNVAAGTFEYELKANNLPSGVYFYKLESGNFVDTKKMVLVK